MKKLSKLGKSVLLSSLAVLAFGGVAAGTTYALFTDRQETNVTVTAGKVSLKATLSDPELYSPTSIDADGTVLDDTNAANETAFKNGGTATIGEDGNVTLTNVAPGDKVTFKIALKNDSTIKTKYSLTAEVEDDVKDFVKTGFEGYEDGYWYTLNEGEVPGEMSLTIEIPTTVTQDQFNGTTDIKLVVNAVQGNAFVNKAVVTDAAELKTMVTAKEDVDIKLGADINDVKLGKIVNHTSLDLNGFSLNMDTFNGQGYGSYITGELKITGDGFIGDKTGGKIGYLFDMYGDGKLIVEGNPTIESGLTCVQLSDNSSALIHGGNWIGGTYNGKYWTINKMDKDKDTAKVEIDGGTFFNFDPSKSTTENPTQNWVKEGYSCGFIQDGENKIYKVYPSVDDILTKDEENLVLDLYKDASFDLNGYVNFVGGEHTKKVTINGNGHTLTFNCTNSDCNSINTAAGLEKLVINNANLTAIGRSTTTGTWNARGLIFDSDVELNNVTSDRLLGFKDGKKSVLHNVTINETDAPSDTYAMWLQTGADVEIDGLTVYSVNKNDGKFNRGIKIDNQYSNSDDKMPADTVTKLSVKNAKFTTQKYSAIDVASTRKSVITLQNVDITGTSDTENAVSVNGDISLVTVIGGTAKQR